MGLVALPNTGLFLLVGQWGGALLGIFLVLLRRTHWSHHLGVGALSAFSMPEMYRELTLFEFSTAMTAIGLVGR